MNIDGALHAKAVTSSLMMTGFASSVLPHLPEHFVLMVAAGAAGSLVRALHFREKWWDLSRTLLTGVLCAPALYPVVQPFMETQAGKMDLDPATAVIFGSFVVGLTSAQLIGWFLDLFQKGGSGDA